MNQSQKAEAGKMRSLSLNRAMVCNYYKVQLQQGARPRRLYSRLYYRRLLLCSVLSHIISQLRPGADLSRVVLPTFILEPRSMLERITKYVCSDLAVMLWLIVIPIESFMAHPETLLPMPTIDDPLERFVSVVKFYLSGWHIKPPYVHSTCSPFRFQR
jgi:hypothetical protein